MFWRIYSVKKRYAVVVVVVVLLVVLVGVAVAACSDGSARCCHSPYERKLSFGVLPKYCYTKALADTMPGIGPYFFIMGDGLETPKPFS